MRQDNFKAEASQNAKKLRNEIETLELISRVDIFTLKTNYKEFWSKASEIRELFKSIKPLLREDREPLWENLNNLCDKVKSRQNKERESFQRDSENKKKDVIYLIKQAKIYTAEAHDRDDINTAKEYLQNALVKLKDQDTRMSKEDNNECWELYKEASEKIRLKRDFLQKISFDNMLDLAYRALGASEYNPHEAVKEIKKFFEEMKNSYISKDQRTFIMKVIEEARENIDRKFEEIRRERERKQKEWEERQQERERKKKEWERIKDEKMDRLQSTLDRMESSKERLEETERRVENKIDELRGKRYSAHGGFADRLEEWIDQEENKLSSIKDRLRELDSKIDSIKDKLSDLRNR